MKQIIELKHHSHDYECMWNGIEDLYMNETGESLPDGFSFCSPALAPSATEKQTNQT